MRESERDQLRKELSPGDPDAADRELCRALGVDINEVRALQQTLEGDLDEDTHGIGWWNVYGDPQRRALASDHLLAATSGILVNLAEAVLHQWERREAWDGVERRCARALNSDGSFGLPPYETAHDLLPEATAVNLVTCLQQARS